MRTNHERDPFYGDRMDDPRLNRSGGPGGRMGRPAFVDDLNNAIRENPVGAGLIGLGIAWFLFGNRGFGTMAQRGIDALGEAGNRAERYTDDTWGDTWGRTSHASGGGGDRLSGDGVAGRGAAMAGSARETVRDMTGGAARTVRAVASTAQDTISHASERISESATEAAGYAAQASRRAMRTSNDAIGSAQETLRDAFERQPLLLGAVGLAIGAGLASAFAKTKIEEEVLGDTSAAVRARAQQLTNAARERAGEVVSEVASEAERQGLTTSAAKEAAAGLADKAKAVANAAIGTVRGSDDASRYE